MRFYLIIAFFLVCAMRTGSASSAPPFEVRVGQGRLQGIGNGAVIKYLGIPYAAAPVGDNRWRAPQPAAKWSGVRRADRFGANCTQSTDQAISRVSPWSAEYLISGPVSEDCLFLNVWTPAHRSWWKRLPVFFWIYGGGFSSGGGDVAVYDGSKLAARGIVVVSINYRLGIYGFFAHPELSAEAMGSSGNYGILDQIAALQWVSHNIAAFGGDPRRVTIAGQSAGAASVHDLILSALAQGLFQRAIAESGSGMGIRLGDKTQAEAAGQRAAAAAGASSLLQLRALTPGQISALSKSGPSAPIADGYVLPLDPDAALASGHYNDTPILTGLNQDEGSARPGYRPRDADAYRSSVAQRYPGFADRFLALYSAGVNEASGPALSRDRGVASMLFWEQQRAKSSRFPIYSYIFTHIEPGPDSAKYGAFHSSEIPYVFDTLDKSPERGFTQLDRDISNRIQTYWVNYVRSGDPNGTGLPHWPQLDEKMQILELGDQVAAREALSKDRLALFKEYVASGGSLGLF